MPDVGLPSGGEIVFDVLAFPINLADIVFCNGRYGTPPQLPGTPGAECVGRIVSVGPGVANLAPGDLVSNLQRENWAQRRRIPAEEAIPLPSGINIAQAAMIRINPATAWLMLTDFGELDPGSWIIQNAANSAVGRHVIAVARRLGLRTLSVVRRQSMIRELTSLGGDMCILDGDDLATRAFEAVEGAPIRLGLDAISGKATGRIAASQDQINWVLTSYIVSAAIMTAPTGFLAARFGRTRFFVISIIGFTIASILCGLAQSIGQIVVFRILQGMFGASLVPLSQSVLFQLFPGNRRGPAMALWGIGVQVGPVLGPILGGWLTEHYSWRWVFYINVPLGVIVAVGLFSCLKETSREARLKLDWIGFAALSIAIGALQITLDRGEQQDWFSSPEIILEIGLAGTSFHIFLIQSIFVQKPFLSPKLFTDLGCVVGLIFIFIIGLILFATLALLSPFLQTLMNYPVVTTGLLLTSRGAGTMASMLLAGQLLARIGARPLVALGFLASAVSLYQMT